jgi:hypothetical protein
MKGSTSVENQEKESTEVITVLGEYSPWHFKREMIKKELDFYSLYNKLINEESREFAIRCRRNSPKGSHVIRNTCKPQYQINIEHQMATSMLNGSFQTRTTGGSNDFSNAGGGTTTTLNFFTGGKGYYDSLSKKKNKKALEFTENLLKESPDLRVKLQDYVDAKMLFEKKLEEHK